MQLWLSPVILPGRHLSPTSLLQLPSAKTCRQERQAVDSTASQLRTCSLYLHSASNKQKGPQKPRPQSVALIPMTQGLPPANLKKIQPRQKTHGECSSGAENSISMHEALGFTLCTTRREGEAERELSKGCERAIIRAGGVCAAGRIWSKFTQEASVRKGEQCGVGTSGMLVLSLGGFHFPLLRGCLAMSEYISSGLHGGKGTWYQV